MKKSCLDCQYLVYDGDYGHNCIRGNFQVIVYYSKLGGALTFIRQGFCSLEQGEENK